MKELFWLGLVLLGFWAFSDPQEFGEWVAALRRAAFE